MYIYYETNNNKTQTRTCDIHHFGAGSKKRAVRAPTSERFFILWLLCARYPDFYVIFYLHQKAALITLLFVYLSISASVPPPEARYALANLPFLLIPMHRRAKQTQESFILTITCHVNPPFQSVI